MNFDTSKEATDLIHAIVHRFNDLHPLGGDILPVIMDLTACHANGCELRLLALLQADNCDFLHDVVGITHHINRETGQLEDCFRPRYAR
jgi:hypothetical protein